MLLFGMFRGLLLARRYQRQIEQLLRFGYEMKLEAITMAQLTNYLYGIETSENMVDVKKMSISKKEIKQGLLTAILQVETVEI